MLVKEKMNWRYALMFLIVLILFPSFGKAVTWSEPIQLTRNTTWEKFPTFSPDGNRVAFVEYHTENGQHLHNIQVVNINDGKIETIFTDSGLLKVCSVSGITNFSTIGANRLSWSPDGKEILFSAFCITPNGERVFRMAIINPDGTNLRILKAGEHPSWSPDGSKIVYLSRFTPFVRTWEECGKEIWVMDRNEENDHMVFNGTRTLFWPSFSPDGKKIVFNRGDIYMIDANGTNLKKLTEYPGDDVYPQFSPDGREILFVSTRSGATELWLMSLDNGNLTQLTFSDMYITGGISFSPDGKKIVFPMFEDNETGFDLWMIKKTEETVKPPEIEEPIKEEKPRFTIYSWIYVLVLIMIICVLLFFIKQKSRKIQKSYTSRLSAAIGIKVRR